MFAGIDIAHFLSAYGYWAVVLAIALESMGLPLPGEATLIAAAVYAGISGRLSIALVIVGAAAGAIVGDNIGYAIGRFVGARALQRVRPTSRRGRTLLVGRFLFSRHGGKAVFFGRFVAVLRIFAAMLAGATGMPWSRFLLYNAGGGVLWAIAIGLLGYGLGASVTGPLGLAGLAIAAFVVLAVSILLWRNGRRWEREALQALPADEAATAA